MGEKSLIIPCHTDKRILLLFVPSYGGGMEIFMKRRSMFSRILTLNIASLLICMFIVCLIQFIVLTNYVTKQSEDYLGRNAETIVNMIQGNIPMDALNATIDSFSRSTGSYILVFDKTGKVVSHTSRSPLADKLPVYVNDDFSKTVLSGKKHSMINNTDFFADTMFTLQIPIKTANNETLGAVSVSRPIPEHQKARTDVLRTFLILIVSVTLVSITYSYFLARKFSVPMKNMQHATNNFAKGKFNARVDETATNSKIIEISELASAFNSMAEELEKSDDIKNTFISDVAHELRTPMTTISGFVGGVLDNTIPPEKQRDYLLIVKDEISRLSRLVNTFLDITRMQSDKTILKKSVFDINEAIRITILGFEQKIEDKQIDIKLNLETDPCLVYADSDSIKRVLTNLTDNAIKFTNQNGCITFKTRQSGNNIKISVKNTGVGISDEQLSMIFKRFYKADKSRSENKEGTGIGLYLVKNIINAHGKDINVDSIEGEYAEFTFNLDKARRIKN